MATHRATAAMADKIANRMRPKWAPNADWQLVRDACDLAAAGEFPPGELDKLTALVQRRIAATAQ